VQTLGFGVHVGTFEPQFLTRARHEVQRVLTLGFGVHVEISLLCFKCADW